MSDLNTVPAATYWLSVLCWVITVIVLFQTLHTRQAARDALAVCQATLAAQTGPR